MSRIVGVQCVRRAILAADAEGARVPRAGVAHFGLGHVDNQVEGRRQHRLIGAPQDRVQAPIDFRQKFSRVGRDRNQLLHQARA